MTHPHYYCTGECRGLSTVSGACRAEECSMRGESLERCDCDDSSSHGLDDGDSSLMDTEDEEEEE